MYHAVSWCQKCSGFFSTQHPSNILWSCWGPYGSAWRKIIMCFSQLGGRKFDHAREPCNCRHSKHEMVQLRAPLSPTHPTLFNTLCSFLRFPEAALAKSQRTLGSHSVVASPESLSTTGRDHDLMSNKRRRLNLLRRFFPCSDGQIPKDPIVIQCHTRKIRLLTPKPCVRQSARCVSTGPRCIATIHNEWSVTNPAIRGQIGQVASA